jgi:hypothetical protein
MQAPVCTRGPSFPKAKPPPTEPMLPNIYEITNFPMRVLKSKVPGISIPAQSKEDCGLQNFNQNKT